MHGRQRIFRQIPCHNDPRLDGSAEATHNMPPDPLGLVQLLHHTIQPFAAAGGSSIIHNLALHERFAEPNYSNPSRPRRLPILGLTEPPSFTI